MVKGIALLTVMPYLMIRLIKEKTNYNNWRLIMQLSLEKQNFDS